MSKILLNAKHSIPINEIMDDLDSFTGELASTSIKDWNIAAVVIPNTESHSLIPTVILSHEDEGNFLFQKKLNKLQGGAFGGADALLSLDSENILTEADRVLGSANNKSINDAHKSYIKSTRKKIKENAESLDFHDFSLYPPKADTKEKIADIFAFMYSEGVDIEKKIAKLTGEHSAIQKEYKRAVAEQPSKEKNKINTVLIKSSQAQIPKQTVGMNDVEYVNFVTKRNKEANKIIKNSRSDLEYDKDNHAEVTIANMLKNGECGILKGDPGTGKTAGVTKISDQNGITVFKKNFDDQTDGTDIEGSATLITNLITGNQEVGWTNGILIEAALHASEASKRGESTICFLDEISRGTSHGILIGHLSKDPVKKEFGMKYGRNMNLMQIDTDKGPLWFEVMDAVDREREQYKITEDLKIIVDKDSDFYQYNGGGVNAEERGNRGDLFSMDRIEFTKILQENKKSIVKSFEGKKCVYVPDFALTVIGATNVSKSGGDQVNELAEALVSRMPLRMVHSSSVEEMVKIVVSSELYLMDWSESVRKNVELVMRAFYEDADKIFKAEDQIIGETIAFRVMSDTVRALDSKDPFGEEGNIFTVLKDSVSQRFAKDTAETPVDAQAQNENVIKAQSISKDLEKRGVSAIARKYKIKEDGKSVDDVFAAPVSEASPTARR